MTSFEYKEIHPRVAALLQKADWLYLHECVLDDNSRIDFVALNPRSGHIAIVECKTHVASVSSLAEQVNHYHRQFGAPIAYKWVFVWDTPMTRTVNRLMQHDIQVFDMENEPDVAPIHPSVGHKSKRIFWETFKQHHLDIFKAWGWA